MASVCKSKAKIKCKKFERALLCRKWEFRGCQSSGQSWMSPVGRGPPVILLAPFTVHHLPPWGGAAFVPHSDAASDNTGGPVERTHARWNSWVPQQAEGGVFGPSWPEMWCCWSRRGPQKCAITGTWCCSNINGQWGMLLFLKSTTISLVFLTMRRAFGLYSSGPVGSPRSCSWVHHCWSRGPPQFIMWMSGCHIGSTTWIKPTLSI